MSDPLPELRSITVDSWLVGGSVRDRLMGRETSDFDVVVAGDPGRLARELGRAADGHPFKLSDAFGGWRVVARDRTWQVDLLPLMGHTIEQDLGHRDLTVNAIAQPVQGGDYLDPFGGIADVHRRRLRMVSPRVFGDDPLRVLRLARVACELAFEVEADTLRAGSTGAEGLRRVAPERVFAELRRIIVAERALDGLALMDELGATSIVLPELTELHGIQQSRYHHLDVHEHTRAVLAETIELEGDPGRRLGEQGAAVAVFLAEPLANELTRGGALRFGALFHDIAKPATRDVTADGRITFMGHDAAGADMVRGALTRLRASERLTEHVAALTRHHLRLGFLVHERPLSRRAIYRYLRTCDPVQVDVTLLSVADRLATRGAGAESAIAKHLELARELLGEALSWRASPPSPPLRGDELARALGIRPGPEIGRVLAQLEEASFVGEVKTREQAIDRARELLDRLPAR